MRLAWIVAIALLATCQHLPGEHENDCAAGDVRLLTDFEQARAADCIRTGLGAFVVSVAPEVSPINPSPWYAFDLETDRPGPVEITLHYKGALHRYHPKRLDAGGEWRRLEDGETRLEGEGSTAVLTLSLPAGRTRIAAQEVFGPEDRNRWVNDFAGRASVSTFVIGRSVEGREITGVRWPDDDQPKPLVIILGGQHPPEVPGVLGLRAFLDRLILENAALSNDYAFLIVPELNPDGVARGHWRTNASLIDLNRDWAPFTQPETRAVRDEIGRLVGLGFAPMLLLDFHATHRNVFYTPESGDDLADPGLASDWLSAIGERWEGEMPGNVAGHNPDNPTAKTWFVDAFTATAITVEYGDETDRNALRALAEASADALAEVLGNRRKKEALP